MLAPSVTALQSLLIVCEDEIYYLDVFISSSKSKCTTLGQVGPRYKQNICVDIMTRDGRTIEEVRSCHHLGIFFISGPEIKTSNDNAKAKHYRAFNFVMGEIGCRASRAVTVSLIKAKRLPMLLYATEACHYSVREYTKTCAPFKLFNTKSSEILENYCKLVIEFRLF